VSATIGFKFSFTNEGKLDEVIRKLKSAADYSARVAGDVAWLGRSGRFDAANLPPGTRLMQNGAVQELRTGQIIGSTKSPLRSNVDKVANVSGSTLGAFGMMGVGAYIGASAYGTYTAIKEGAEYERIARGAQSAAEGLDAYRRALNDIGATYGNITNKTTEFYSLLKGIGEQGQQLKDDLASLSALNVSGIYSQDLGAQLTRGRQLLGGQSAPSDKLMQALIYQGILQGGLPGRNNELAQAIARLTEAITASAGALPGQYERTLREQGGLVASLSATNVPGLQGQQGANLLGTAGGAIQGGGWLTDLALVGAMQQSGTPLTLANLWAQRNQGGSLQNLQAVARQIVQMSGGNEDTERFIAAIAFHNQQFANASTPQFLQGILNAQALGISEQDIQDVDPSRLTDFVAAAQRGDKQAMERIRKESRSGKPEMGPNQRISSDVVHATQTDLVKAGDNLKGVVDDVANTLRKVNQGLGQLEQILNKIHALDAAAYGGTAVMGGKAAFDLGSWAKNTAGTLGVLELYRYVRNGGSLKALPGMFWKGLKTLGKAAPEAGAEATEIFGPHGEVLSTVAKAGASAAKGARVLGPNGEAISTAAKAGRTASRFGRVGEFLSNGEMLSTVTEAGRFASLAEGLTIGIGGQLQNILIKNTPLKNVPGLSGLSDIVKEASNPIDVGFQAARALWNGTPMYGQKRKPNPLNIQHGLTALKDLGGDVIGGLSHLFGGGGGHHTSSGSSGQQPKVQQTRTGGLKVGYDPSENLTDYYRTPLTTSLDQQTITRLAAAVNSGGGTHTSGSGGSGTHTSGSGGSGTNTSGRGTGRGRFVSYTRPDEVASGGGGGTGGHFGPLGDVAHGPGVPVINDALSIGGANDHAAFVKALMPIARAVSAKTGLPPDFFLGLAADESNWGNLPNNSLFGVAWTGGLKSVGNSSGWVGQGYATVNDAFQGLIDLISQGRYASAWQRFQKTGDVAQFLHDIKEAGYDDPRDPNYATWDTGLILPLMRQVDAIDPSAATVPGAPAPSGDGTAASDNYAAFGTPRGALTRYQQQNPYDQRLGLPTAQYLGQMLQVRVTGSVTINYPGGSVEVPLRPDQSGYADAQRNAVAWNV
jgi:hypothetical protein